MSAILENNILPEKGMKIPEYPGWDGKLFDCNNSCYLRIVNNTSEKEFADYCKKLENIYNKKYEKKREDNIFCGFTAKEEDVLVHLYYIGAYKTAKIITEPHPVFVKDLGCAFGEKEIHQLSLDQRQIDCGMSYIIKCPDNSVFMIDGGFFTKGECDSLYNYLVELVGEKIIISGWYFTHAHEDHIGCFMDFVEKYGDKVKIEQLIFNFPSLDLPESDSWRAEDVVTLKRFYSILEKHLKDTPMVKLHTGQEFTVKGLHFEVLYTHEDIFPKPVGYYNDTSTVLMMTANGKKTLWTGDMADLPSDFVIDVYGKDLKCDIVQVAHHGFNGAKKLVYQLADPSIALWPTPDYRFDENASREANQFLLKESRVERHIISGYGTGKIVL